MNHYCVFFSDAYFIKGIALYRSLLTHETSPFKLWIMCLGTKSYEKLTSSRLVNTSIISLSELERFDPELMACKTTRSEYEYYASCKASMMLYILKNNSLIDRITYLDADLYSFGNLGDYFATIAASSIALTPHRYTLTDSSSFDRGIYNAGWISIKSDEAGLMCLEWWRNQVIEWCFNRIEDGKYADQKYLDSFPLKFCNFISVGHIGINAAPWNVKGLNFRSENGKIFIDGAPLLVYHFHGLIKISKRLYDSGTSNYSAPLKSKLNKHVYTPYIEMLNEVADDYPDFADGIATDRNRKVEHSVSYLYVFIYSLLRIAKRILFRSYIIIK